MTNESFAATHFILPKIFYRWGKIIFVGLPSSSPISKVVLFWKILLPAITRLSRGGRFAAVWWRVAACLSLSFGLSSGARSLLIGVADLTILLPPSLSLNLVTLTLVARFFISAFAAIDFILTTFLLSSPPG